MEKFRILIFAGTTESRIIAECLKAHPVDLYLSVATDYGRESFGSIDHARVISGRLSTVEIGEFLRDNKIDIVIDATHPFARIVTENIKKACTTTGKEYIRCLREQSADIPAEGAGRIVSVASIQKAVEYLKKTEGNILISTGSKELSLYTELAEYRERCYVRVLSTVEAVKVSVDLGFTGKHLFAMQGPFSREMNIAMLRQTGAKYFVTKDSGLNGGLEEKIQAAQETGNRLIMVERPEEKGMDVKEVCTYLQRRVCIE